MRLKKKKKKKVRSDRSGPMRVYLVCIYSRRFGAARNDYRPGPRADTSINRKAIVDVTASTTHTDAKSLSSQHRHNNLRLSKVPRRFNPLITHLETNKPQQKTAASIATVFRDFLACRVKNSIRKRCVRDLGPSLPSSKAAPPSSPFSQM